MPRLALYAITVCVLAVVAAVISFAQGNLLGIVWVLLAGLSSNMAWFYVRLQRAQSAGFEGRFPGHGPTAQTGYSSFQFSQNW